MPAAWAHPARSPWQVRGNLYAGVFMDMRSPITPNLNWRLGRGRRGTPCAVPMAGAGSPARKGFSAKQTAFLPHAASCKSSPSSLRCSSAALARTRHRPSRLRDRFKTPTCARRRALAPVLRRARNRRWAVARDRHSAYGRCRQRRAGGSAPRVPQAAGVQRVGQPHAVLRHQEPCKYQALQ